uniref:Small ribosomal subunit protein eS1 n=1 Tax=Lygus hesperus TaxID=30085 RepID=A0A0A9WJB8_LYGHE
MTIDKNRKVNKKKGNRKVADPFLKKEWYSVKAPTYFSIKKAGYTLASKTQGLKTSHGSLLGRIFKLNIADLSSSKIDDFRKVLLRTDDINGTQCLTSFAGMEITSDKHRSIIRKRHTTVEAWTDVKTKDGYLLRVFVIGITKSNHNQISQVTYASTHQVRKLRQVILNTIRREFSSSDVKSLMLKLTTEVVGKTVEKISQGIYPLQNVLVRKVKVLQFPKSNPARLLELHGGLSAIQKFEEEYANIGMAVDRVEDKEASVTPTEVTGASETATAASA